MTKKFSEFLGVPVGVRQKILMESEARKIFSAVGVGIGVKKVDSAGHYFAHRQCNVDF
jgi:hypothetical protein